MVCTRRPLVPAKYALRSLPGSCLSYANCPGAYLALGLKVPVELVGRAIILILKRMTPLGVRRASDGSAAHLSPSSRSRSSSSFMVATHATLLAADMFAAGFLDRHTHEFLRRTFY